MPSNHNKSNFKITETAPFPPRRLSNTSIAIHSNSIAGYVIMFTIRLLYSKPIVNGSRYWIWMNSYWNVRKSVRWKGSSFCDFEIGLVVIWRHLSHFWHIRFLYTLSVYREKCWGWNCLVREGGWGDVGREDMKAFGVMAMGEDGEDR